MTTPVSDGTSADDFLATTQENESGEIITEYVALRDVPLEILWHYTTMGDERAAAELASRISTDTVPTPEGAS